MEVVQPVVAGRKDEPPGAGGCFGPQGGLVHFQLDGVQNGLLAHGLHDAAGAQHRQPALDPDVGVEGTLGHLFAALDGEGHSKAAGVTGIFGLSFQRLGDHLTGDMVDGGFSDRLVEAGFCHPAYSFAAGNADVRGVGQQGDRGDHRQPGGHVHIVAAVLFDGTFGPGIRFAAEQGSHFHHDALRGAEGDGLRGIPGQQQPGCPRRPQRRAGAGGVAAAQQLLPAADVVLKLGFRRLWGAEQGFVLLPAQVVKGLDVLRRKGFFGRQHAGNALR